MPRYIDVERFCEENPDFDSAVYVALSKAPTIYEKSVKKIDLMDTVDDMSSWIRVKDSIPKRFESVLCYYPDKDYGSKSMVDYNQCDEGETPYFSNQCLWGRCTHWMPLPEPPEESEHETD